MHKKRLRIKLGKRYKREAAAHIVRDFTVQSMVIKSTSRNHLTVIFDTVNACITATSRCKRIASLSPDEAYRIKHGFRDPRVIIINPPKEMLDVTSLLESEPSLIHC